MTTMLLAFLALACSLIAFAYGQVATPVRPIGFVFNNGSPSAKVHLDIFLDLVCSDSKAAWPAAKDIAMYYGANNMRLTVYLFPLPYHRNAFYASRATFVVHALTNGTKTFDWIDAILLDRLEELKDTAFHDKSDQDLLDYLARVASQLGVDPVQFKEKADRRSRNEFETYTRFMWKYACTRGAAETPTYMVNGIAHPNIKPFWIQANWRDFLDPLMQPQLFDSIAGIPANYTLKGDMYGCSRNRGAATTDQARSVFILSVLSPVVFIQLVQRVFRYV